MAALAWILASIGGLSAVMGIITAAEVIPVLGAEFTPMFWLTLGVVLLLSGIAAAVGNRPNYE